MIGETEPEQGARPDWMETQWIRDGQGARLDWKEVMMIEEKKIEQGAKPDWMEMTKRGLEIEVETQKTEMMLDVRVEIEASPGIGMAAGKGVETDETKINLP